ncbi:DUF4097 family beta strand repeat-containing protein [Sinomonas sp. R1AF57]|uniref:DUF4097 family beta strand repeat-containing protein n=1 Tax=Sinomonas sp. R1AF57 TaxID=2020377 RepID=UPI000B5DFE5A|nr:DUF4097 family beta strand repeat-containing protein [Sinomonas sp. R1AF57]ASN50742.1 hypothetical protein CGQ25_00420 [Sinomonas sp. R1AF57]
MEQFETQQPVRALIELSLGDVIVHASEQNTATVEVAPVHAGRKADKEAAEATAVDFWEGRLEVLAPKVLGLGFLGRPGAVVVTVKLPAGSDLEASTAFGDIIATGALARAKAKTHAGDVRVEDGVSLELETSAGDVEVGRVREEASLVSSTGGVRVEDVTGALRVKCTTGEVSLGRVAGAAEVTCPYGSIRVREAVSGSLSITSTYSDLVVGIAVGTAAKVDVSTSHGRIRNELSRSASPPAAAERLELTARTSYGSVTIRRA